MDARQVGANVASAMVPFAASYFQEIAGAAKKRTRDEEDKVYQKVADDALAKMAKLGFTQARELNIDTTLVRNAFTAEYEKSKNPIYAGFQAASAGVQLHKTKEVAARKSVVDSVVEYTKKVISTLWENKETVAAVGKTLLAVL